MSTTIDNPCIYIYLMGLVLSTISSDNYLKAYKIRNSNIKAQTFIDSDNNVRISPDSDWSKFIEKFNNLAKQGKKVLLKTYPPGLYVEDFGDYGVHFYGLNKNGIMANGYPSNGDFTNGVGFGYQEESSHGFCQTFALMHVLGMKNDFKSSNDDPSVWSDNGKKAVKFLVNFTTKYNWEWLDLDELYKELSNIPITPPCPYNQKDVEKLIKGVYKNDSVLLSDLVKILVKNEEHFDKWYEDRDEPEEETEDETEEETEDEDMDNSASDTDYGEESRDLFE